MLIGALSAVALGCNPPPPRTSRAASPTEATAASPPGAEPTLSREEAVARAEEFPPDPTLKGEALPIDGSDLVRGRATVMVDAPIDKVRATLLDFEKYPEFMPEFSRSRILNRLPDGGKQVYQEMSILGGTIRIWANVKIPQAKNDDGVETHATEFVEGNVKDYQATWRLRAVDESHTELTAELYLIPKLFVPTSWINGKNVEGAAKAVQAMKRRVETTP